MIALELLASELTSQAPGATLPTYSFIYQRDTYVYNRALLSFFLPCQPAWTSS